MSDITPVLTNAESIRKKIESKLTTAISEVFPIDLKGRTLELTNVQLHEKEFSSPDQKKALLTGTSLNSPLKGTVTLKDKDGKVLDEVHNFTLAQVPFFTDRHTMIADGNEYQIANQLRRKPGVYTQRAQNGELKSIFNLGRGKNFDIGFNDKKGTFYLQYGTSNIPLYPVLRGLGMSHHDIQKHWGPVANENEDAYGHQVENNINKLYQKLEHPALINNKLSQLEKIDAIKKQYNQSILDRHVTEQTLGHAHDKVTPETMALAAKKILAVHNEKEPVDDTDSLTFKTFHSVDDFLAERVKITGRLWARKAKLLMSGKSKIRDGIKPSPFSDTIKKFVTTSSLTAVPSGINPLEYLDHAVKVTALGEGGISSDRAIPLDARMTHSTHFGSLDPIRTPECFSKDTEVFTKDGWKFWPDVTEDDLLACRIEGKLEFHKPIKLIKSFYEGIMYGAENTKLSYLVTPNHNMWVCTKENFYSGSASIIINDVFKLEQAETIHQKERLFISLHQPFIGEITQVISPLSDDFIYTGNPEEREHFLNRFLAEGGKTKKLTNALFFEKTAILLGVCVKLKKIKNGYKLKKFRFSIRPIQPNEHFTQEYNDFVYCAEVPGHLLYTRRNGRLPFWSGNSNHAGVDVRATIAAHRDDKGNLYTAVNDAKSGKQVFIKSGDLTKHVIAFPNQTLTGKVDAFVHGEVQHGVDAKTVTHQMPHYGHQYSPATTLIPMLHNIQGNRAIMGSKMGTQALPLIEREAPFLQSKSHVGDHSFETVYGHLINPVAPVSGKIEKIENGYIYIRPHKNQIKTSAKDDLIKVHYEEDFPFPSKTFLNHTLDVKKGDHVEEGQRLADSNFTRNGTMALGKNLRVAYMPYYGMNSNDAVVISEGCAKKLTSEHMYRETFPFNSQTELNKDKHKIYYGTKYTPEQYGKLDAKGIIKKGSVVHTKDPLVVALVKTQIQGNDLLLGKISKVLTRPYQEQAITWTHGTPGTVVDVVESSNQIAILIKTQEQMQVGDKLAGRYGNKGVVAKIVPDHEMIQDEQKRPIDLLLTSASVVSRINPAQIIETSVGKVVEKTGKPIIYDNNEHKNANEWAKNLLKKHDVKDKETVYDPMSKRYIRGGDGKGVLVGRQYIYKLFKSTDTNFSGHGVGPYDVNEQPLKTGGEEGAKGIGKMEFDALIAHNARNFLQEAATIKGQKNDEFWKAIQTGSPLPTPKPSFAFNKFVAMLEGSGLKVNKQDSKFKILPMTNKDILSRSNGAIQNKQTLIAKNLKPETGGLFDPIRTGGTQGTLYSHIDLHEGIPNPVFIEPVRRLLGLSQKEFQDKIKLGGDWFKTQLSNINVEAKIKELRTKIKTAKGPELDNVVKQIKYLEALKKNDLKPQDAYLLNHVPVIPPVFRPILPQPNNPGQLMVADANKLYAHLIDTNEVVKNTVLPSDLPKHREMLFHAVGAVFGTHQPLDEKLQKQDVKGFLTNIAGSGSPKGGFFQRKLMRRTQDVSGRGTAVPDGNLGMDEVGIPEQMLWQMYDKILVSRLIKQGYSALMARELVDKKAPIAKDALLNESKVRPVLINRAPTLHRWSIISAYPKMVQGKTIRVSPFIEKGMNLDYDGDTLQVHVPITQPAIEDAKQMSMSNLLLSDQQRNKIIAFPQHEAVIGLTLASKAVPNGLSKGKTFETKEKAIEAWRKGELKLTDQVTIEKEN